MFMGDWSSGGVRLVLLDGGIESSGGLLEPKKTLNMNGTLSERTTVVVSMRDYVPRLWHD